MKPFIKDLNSNKSVNVNVPTNILRESEFMFSVLGHSIKKSFETATFPAYFKEVNITPIFKKIDPLNKENYRPQYTSAAL